MIPVRLRLPRRRLLALAGGVLAASARPQAGQGASRAEVAVPTVSLGMVGLGTDPDVTFAIRNTGDRDLTMTVGRLGAGLRLVSHDATVRPGATGTVRVAIDTFKAGATTAWTVPVTTNDPARDTVILQVQADVRAFILVTPPASRITYVQYEREGGTEHLIGAAGHPDFRVTRVESPYPFLDAYVEEARDVPRPEALEGGLYTVRLVIRKAAQVGPLHANVVVHTNHPKQPRTWIPVSGFVRPLLGVTPPQFVLTGGAPASGGPAATQSVVVTNFAEALLDLVEVRSSLPGCEVTATPLEPGRRWRVEVRSTGQGNPGRGEVTLRTSRDDVPVVRVPLERR